MHATHVHTHAYRAPRHTHSASHHARPRRGPHASIRLPVTPAAAALAARGPRHDSC